MIKICDVIMGGGKSQSAITYMNEHPERRFVYITPFVSETERIARDCPNLNFVLPSNKLPQFNFSKVEHTRWLLKIGANIATTHVAFRSYTDDMLEYIREHNYVLIADEAVDVFTEMSCSTGDLKVLMDAGCIKQVGDHYEKTDKEYTGVKLRDLYEAIRCNNLIQVPVGDDGMEYYYWALPPEALIAFGEVYVLTYLFASSEFKYFLDIYGIPYTYIGVSYDNGVYRFSDKPEYTPSYVHSISEKIHVFGEEKKERDVGRNYHALSSNWFRNHPTQTAVLKNNVYNFLRHKNPHCKGEDIMWSCFKECKKNLRGDGYSKQHIEFNAKAKNEYRHKTVLAYCVNIFQKPSRVRFFKQFGIDYDIDGYALSTMIQWIWRSAIRDGKPISVYIPSRRMRELLLDWLSSLSMEVNASETVA